SDPMATIGSSEFDEKVIDSSVIDEQLDTTTENVDNNIEFDTTLNETNFADNFIKLLDNDLSNYDIGVLPITENLYSNLDKGIILEDAYNNGYIILRIGLNTEDNTFMCLIRSINQRTYLKGTLIDGKLDTIISTVVQ
ncbi:MAG: hypothetical protein IJZ36_05330, partial [Bacilli bacterium]|nr:hypothetical protein [Bacilli bacterium]